VEKLPKNSLYSRPQMTYKNVQERMAMQKFNVFSQPEDVNNRLAQLGLKAVTLREAVQRGFASWASCTMNHPTNYPGISFWANTTAALRELLHTDGWKRRDDGNLPLTVDAEGRVSVIVSTGDEYTGLPDLTPSTRSSKGPRTVSVVTINAQQMPLFDFKGHPEIVKQGEERLTWILLFYRDKTSNDVRCELSCPVKINEDGQIDAWAERIILPSIPFGGENLEVPNDVPKTPEIDVKITRKKRA
jgi:hypothetical protein